MKKYLITSALPYANGFVHLGHVAGAYLPADIFVRYLRLSGKETLYVCGSDEHGVAITIAAEKEKISPKEVIDKYHYANKSAFENLGISFDIFSRTSNKEHHILALEFFSKFLNDGLLVEKEEEQFYDASASMFLPDRYVEGICPNCGNDKARGDQCDSCGAYYNQLELKSPKSLISGATPIVKKTLHWYFPFGKFQTWLEEYIESNASTWKDNVLQQTRSWLKSGLADRAYTRDLSWGVSIENAEGIDINKARGKVLYVWFDAVLGYISATKEYLTSLGQPQAWKEWWQSPDTEYYAFIGKDNIVFHTIIFPAMLHGASDSNNHWILPKNVPANEFLNLEGQKFSKSRNWSIDLKDFPLDFPSEMRTDALRYALAMNFPESKDADFTWSDFQARNNNELAAILGNFVNRTLQFLFKINTDGTLPELSGDYTSFEQNWIDFVKSIEDGKVDNNTNLSDNDKALASALVMGKNRSRELFEKFRFRDAISEIMNVARAANKYFNDEEPWKAVKVSPELCNKSIWVCSQAIASLSILFAPILPNSSKYIRNLLKLDNYCGQAKGSTYNEIDYWSKVAYPLVDKGSKITKPDIIFTRIEDEEIKKVLDKLGDKTQEKANTQGDEQDTIDFEDFKKVKLLTAKVLDAVQIPKSKKLLKLKVDDGSRTRQIVAGIAEHYTAEQMIGKNIVIVANLKPAKLMGELSEGMLLAVNTENSLSVINPGDDTLPGKEVR